MGSSVPLISLQTVSCSLHLGIVKVFSNECLSSLQVCGNNPYVMTRCAQMLEEKTDIDFIDVNLGCPIELVYQQVHKAVSYYWIHRIL